MAESVYVLTEAKLQSMVTAIMQQVNIRIGDYIDNSAINSDSRTDKTASPKAVYNALQNVAAVVPVINSNKLAVDFNLIPNPSDKVLYVILDSADATEGIPYIFIPDENNSGEGTFIRVCQVDENEIKYEHKEFTNEQISNIISAAVEATTPVFE